MFRILGDDLGQQCGLLALVLGIFACFLGFLFGFFCFLGFLVGDVGGAGSELVLALVVLFLA